ncbi:unnamed protein product, partial [Candidula unifasciata]
MFSDSLQLDARGNGHHLQMQIKSDNPQTTYSHQTTYVNVPETGARDKYEITTPNWSLPVNPTGNT